MVGMIDIHSHILPGLDDGSKSFEESLEMLRMAYGQGVRKVIATPHLSPLFRRYGKSDALRLFSELVKRTKETEEFEDLTLYLGQEIFWCEDTWRAMQEGGILTMAGSAYVLIEFHPEEALYEITRAVRETVTLGYIPLIAHVERFSALRDMSRIKEIRGLGGRIQMNLGSISGKLLDRRVAYCRKLLKKRLVDVLGTDMHNTEERRPRCEKAVEWILKHLDPGYAGALLKDNGERILGDSRIFGYG